MHKSIKKKQMVFLGGAPKCGTSAFFSMLSQTGLFTPSKPKETFFYIDRNYPLYKKGQNFFEKGHSAFLNFFDKASIGKPLLEATTQRYHKFFLVWIVE
jgi:hypothetical protein